MRFDSRQRCCGSVFGGDSGAELRGVVAELAVGDGGAYGLGEAFSGEMALLDGCGTDFELIESARPERLISDGAWHGDAGDAGTQGRGGGASTAVMGNRSHPRKEPLVRSFADGQHIIAAGL
jgi:hypothetical protein